MEKLSRLVKNIIDLEISMIIELFMTPIYTVEILIKSSSRSAGRFQGKYARIAMIIQSVVDCCGCICFMIYGPIQIVQIEMRK